MSKLALINREQKRRKTVKKFAAKRAELQALVDDQKLAPEDRYEARLKAAEAAAGTRVPFVCATAALLTGRPRGVYRKFGLARGKLREIAMRGEIPGVIKASW